MTNNPTIDGVSRELLTNLHKIASRKCKSAWSAGVCDELRALLAAPAVERQETVEKVDHPNFLEFAICDTCAAESLCCEVAPNEHLCGGCYWAPINEKAHADQVTALQSTIARLEARVAELESGFFQEVLDEDLKKISDFVGDGDLPKRSFFLRPDAADLANMTMHMVRNVQSLRIKVAELESGRGEPVAEIANKYGDPEAFAERELRELTDIQKLPCNTKLYAAPPAPVAVAHENLVYARELLHAWKCLYEDMRWNDASTFSSTEEFLGRLDATAALNGVKS